MKLSDVYKIADGLAPKALSDELCAKYGMYDNSGLLVNAEEEINSILFSLDLSERAVEEAIAKKVDLIITHHPVIYGKISSVNGGEGSLLGKKLVRCIKAGISVLSMHLNLDGARGGIDESLMEGILLSAGKSSCGQATLQLPLTEGGYGRAYDVGEIDLFALAENLKKTFSTKRVEVYGEQTTKIRRVASFCGAGADEGSVAFALAQGAQAIISSDFKHHVLSLALESGLQVITLTHYASEAYGFKKYYEKISRQVEIPCYYHEDSNLL